MKNTVVIVAFPGAFPYMYDDYKNQDKNQHKNFVIYADYFSSYPTPLPLKFYNGKQVPSLEREQYAVNGDEMFPNNMIRTIKDALGQFDFIIINISDTIVVDALNDSRINYIIISPPFVTGDEYVSQWRNRMNRYSYPIEYINRIAEQYDGIVDGISKYNSAKNYFIHIVNSDSDLDLAHLGIDKSYKAFQEIKPENAKKKAIFIVSYKYCCYDFDHITNVDDEYSILYPMTSSDYEKKCDDPDGIIRRTMHRISLELPELPVHDSKILSDDTIIDYTDKNITTDSVTTNYKNDEDFVDAIVQYYIDRADDNDFVIIDDYPGIRSALTNAGIHFISVTPNYFSRVEWAGRMFLAGYTKGTIMYEQYHWRENMIDYDDKNRGDSIIRLGSNEYIDLDKIYADQLLYIHKYLNE